MLICNCKIIDRGINMLDLREVKEFIKDSLGLIATVVAVFLIIIYVVTIQQVVGPSMNSTLKDGENEKIGKILNTHDYILKTSGLEELIEEELLKAN